MAQDKQLACRNVQNSATNRVFLVSVSRYASSKSAIFATNFEHFIQALDYEQALKKQSCHDLLKNQYNFPEK